MTILAYETDPSGELARRSIEEIRTEHYAVLRAWAQRLGAEPAPATKREALEFLERTREELAS